MSAEGGHLGWRSGSLDTILKIDHVRTIPARFGLIWFSSFRGEDLNVIFYQNMPNLHNRYKSASSTTKTGRHDIAKILFKVALKHQKSK